jgi:hypothetical protein
MRNYINQNADLTRKNEDLTGRRKWWIYPWNLGRNHRHFGTTHDKFGILKYDLRRF